MNSNNLDDPWMDDPYNPADDSDIPPDVRNDPKICKRVKAVPFRNKPPSGSDLCGFSKAGIFVLFARHVGELPSQVLDVRST